MLIVIKLLQVTVELGVQGLELILEVTSCAGKPLTDIVVAMPTNETELITTGIVMELLCSTEQDAAAQDPCGAPKASEKSNGPETVRVNVADTTVFVMEDDPGIVIT